MYVFVPANLIAAPLGLWLAALRRLGARPGRKARARCPISPSALLAFAGHFWIAPASRPPRRSRSTTTRASPTPGNSRMRSASTRAPRPSAISRSIRAPTCISRPACPTTRPSACRPCRPTPISASISTAKARSASCATSPTRRRPISASCRCTTPIVIKKDPKTFVVQFGGGISTEVALHSGAKDVTVAEGNPAVLARSTSDVFRKFTGDILVESQGHRLRGPPLSSPTRTERYDVIDLSLADSVGLSNPGGFAIVEKYPYTNEAMETYMRALAPGGVLSVTLWNKEEPPKSVLKLYATMAAAGAGGRPPRRPPIRSSSPRAISRPRRCSTSAAASRRTRSTKLRKHTRDMSFDEIYSPAFRSTARRRTPRSTATSQQIFGGSRRTAGARAPTRPPTADPTAPPRQDAGDDGAPPSGKADDGVAARHRHGPARLACLIDGGWPRSRSAMSSTPGR